jgi:alpha-tubulin suppressor-like RCC1 family protein
MDDVVSVSAGGSCTMALKTDGSLWVWGGNGHGSLGLGDGIIAEWSPVMLMDNVVSFFLSASGISAAAIRTDGSLWVWGHNLYGQVGDGTTIQRYTPVKIMDDVQYYSTSGFTSMAVKTDGSLWVWGINNGNPFSHPQINILEPLKIMDNITYASINIGQYKIIKPDGSLWAWGGNNQGQVGDGTVWSSDINSYSKIMDDVKHVSLGLNYATAIKTDGSLWVWGSNYAGQLGDGTRIDRHSPIKIMDDVIYATSSDYRTMIIKTDGSIWGWGASYDENNFFAINNNTNHTHDYILDSIMIMDSNGNWVDNKSFTPETPTITTQPSDITVGLGGTVTLSVTANVSQGNLEYQWYRISRVMPFDAVAINGATSATYSVPTDEVFIGHYACTVYNVDQGIKTAGISSSIGRVIVTPLSTPTALSVQAGNVTGQLDAVVSLSPTSTLFAYQWYRNTTNSNTGGTTISGATSATFSIPTNLTAGTYYYFCEVTAPGMEAVRSNVSVVTCTVPSVININLQPDATTTLPVGGTWRLYCRADVSPSNATPSYQWYRNTTNSNIGGTPISGATSGVYLIPSNQVGTFYYFCEVSAPGATTRRSNVSMVRIETLAITIHEQPAPITTVTAGNISGRLRFSASVQTWPSLSYQWYRNTSNSNVGGTAIQGEIGSGFTIPTNLIAGTYFYYCVVSYPAAGLSQRSSVATVTVNNVPPNITIGSITPYDVVTVTEGRITGSFTVAASVSPSTTLSYQWFNSNGVAISGATSRTFAIPTNLRPGTYVYYCEVRAPGAVTRRTGAVNVIVFQSLTDTQRVSADLATITWSMMRNNNTSQNSITGNLHLPRTGANGSMITWTSSNTSVISTAGVVTRPPRGSANRSVRLTATVRSGNATAHSIPIDLIVLSSTINAMDFFDRTGTTNSGSRGRHVTRNVPVGERGEFLTSLLSTSSLLPNVRQNIYDLLFVAQYRPNVFGGYKIDGWPHKNPPGTQGISANDEVLGTVKWDWGAQGCFAYALFCPAYVYGYSGKQSDRIIFSGTLNATNVRAFINRETKTGEHIRYNYTNSNKTGNHSIAYLAEDSSGAGFYFLSYFGGSSASNHIIRLEYITYADFASLVNSFSVWQTKRTVGTANRIIVRAACPIDMIISLNGEELNSATGQFTASFGNMMVVDVYDGKNIEVELDYNENYDFHIIGTEAGTMNLSVYYDTPDNNRTFLNVCVTENTTMNVSPFHSDSAMLLSVSYNNTDEVIYEVWYSLNEPAIKLDDEFDMTNHFIPPDVLVDAKINALKWDDIKGLNISQLNVTSNLQLPTTNDNDYVEILWVSNDLAITGDGIVTRGNIEKTVLLTATVVCEDIVDTVSFILTVPALSSDETSSRSNNDENIYSHNAGNISSAWQNLINQINDAKTGDIITTNVRNSTIVSVAVFNALKGKDVTLVLNMTNYSWTINGLTVQDIPAGVNNYNLRVRIINNVALSALAQHKDISQLELTHKGVFPFNAVLTWYVGNEHSGKPLFFYYYNEATGELEYVSNETVDIDGNVKLPFSHASKYVLTTETVHDETGAEVPPPVYDLDTDFIFIRDTITLRFTIGNTAYTKNDTLYAASTAPYIAGDNRTMMPLRTVVEALGASVEWDEKTQTVYIYKNETRLSLIIGEPLPNGMGTPVLTNDSTFVPVRYIAEALGAIVEWDEINQGVIIYYNK